MPMAAYERGLQSSVWTYAVPSTATSPKNTKTITAEAEVAVGFEPPV
jgi:hypothetical protein